jgi:hypothetical protein
LRSWEENLKALDLAECWDIPAISGGDRHGAEPNAVVNLTHAVTFSEFVTEIRQGSSQILFMPHYGRPRALRVIQIAVDVVRSYPGHALGEHWDERAYHPDRHGALLPLSELWSRQPAFINAVFSVLRLVESGPLRRFANSSIPRSAEQMRLSMQGEEGQ